MKTYRLLHLTENGCIYSTTREDGYDLLFEYGAGRTLDDWVALLAEHNCTYMDSMIAFGFFDNVNYR